MVKLINGSCHADRHTGRMRAKARGGDSGSSGRKRRRVRGSRGRRDPGCPGYGGAMNEALAADQWEVGTLSAAAVNSLAIYGAYCIADIGHSEGGLYTLCRPESPIAKVKGNNPSYPDVYGDAEYT